VRSRQAGLAIAVCLLVGASTSGQDDAAGVEPALARARAAIDAGQAAMAVQQLTDLRSADPRVRRLLGVAYYHHDDYPRAIDVLAPLVGQFPRDSLEGRETVQVLGLSCYLAGRLAEAIPLLEETRVWATDNIELAQVLGVAYIQTRQPDKAVAPLAQAFGVEPGTAGAHLLTAQMMVRLEFHDQADVQLRKALALDPRLPQANLLLGQNAVFRNHLDEGIEYFRKELATNPGNATALYRLGEAYSRQPDWDRAIPPLQQSLWINPYFSGPYIVLGRAYLAKGQPSTAEGMLRRAVEYDPNNKSARYLYGQVLQRLGRAEAAKEQFDAAARLQDSSR
jgi:tetratricopeptide (TPR) repeat protein